MATFYIQLQDKLLQISGDLTADNISKALGYVPVSPNVTNELSQRVDNITFDSLKDNPFLQDGSGELNIVDEVGNIIAKIDVSGIHSVDFIVGDHKLTDKIDSSALNGYAKESWVSTEITKAVTEGKVDLTGYATEEWVENKNYLTEHQDISHLATKQEVSNIDFYNINNNPIVNNGDDKLLFVDENGYIGLQLEEDGLYVKDVIADSHTLSQKADKSELPTKVSDLENDSGFITINDVPEVTVPTKVSELENDSKFITIDEVPEVTVPTKTSELTNDSGFITINDVPVLEIPDEYVTDEELSQKGYATKEWVNNNNYATEYDLNNIEYSSIKNIPTFEDETGELNIVDENGNIGMRVSSEAVYAKDFISGEHKLSEKVNKTYVDNSIADIVDGAPETLNTLNELSAALKDNADIVDVLNQSISSKQDKIDNIVISEDVNEELDDVETNTYIKYVAQTLTEEQKSQVRSNIEVLSESDVNNLIDTKIGDINSILENIINGN